MKSCARPKKARILNSRYTHYPEEDIYSEEGSLNLIENDEISPIEQGFMYGYLGAEDA